jgi:hypothetical protein
MRQALCILAMGMGAVSCVTAPRKQMDDRIFIRHCVAEGAIPLDVKTSDQMTKAFPPPIEIIVKKVWSHGQARPTLTDFLTSRFGDKDVLKLHIANTTYALILVAGKPQPLLIELEEWNVWEINGLTDRFSMATSISNWAGGISLTHRSGDFREIWELHLSPATFRVKPTFLTPFYQKLGNYFSSFFIFLLHSV